MTRRDFGCAFKLKIMLTGKAKSNFIEYHYNQLDFTKESHEENYEMFLHQTEVTHQLASIIEWFDSVGIYVETGVYPCQEDGNVYFSGSFFGKMGGWDDKTNYKCRQQATEQTIINANEIYNGN